MSQTVANSPLGSYRVAAKTTAQEQIQFVQLDIGDGDGTLSPVTALNPLPISGSFSASLASSSTASEGVVSVDNTVGGTQILAANANRKDAEVRVSINASQGVYIARDTSASATSRFYGPGDRIPLASGAAIYKGAVFAFVASGTANVEYTEI